MKRYLVILAVVFATLLIFICTRTAAIPPEGPKTAPTAQEPNLLKLPNRKEAMVLKLKSSQRILEGIALNDYAMIATAADELIAISNYNDFLNAYKGEEYQFHVQIFRRPAEMIAKKAKEKNMDGVMVAYNDMTLSCLKCHQAMRDNKFEVKLERRETRVTTDEVRHRSPRQIPLGTDRHVLGRYPDCDGVDASGDGGW